jgi:hypothetical protein
MLVFLSKRNLSKNLSTAALMNGNLRVINRSIGLKVILMHRDKGMGILK